MQSHDVHRIFKSLPYSIVISRLAVDFSRRRRAARQRRSREAPQRHCNGRSPSTYDSVSRRGDHRTVGLETDHRRTNQQRIPAASAASGIERGCDCEASDRSFVAGAATNVQFMVKDSKKYGSTSEECFL